MPPEDSGSLLDVLGNDRARRILSALDSRRLSARELADRLDVSRATVYRQLDALRTQDLVCTARQVRADGTHETLYGSDLEAVVVTFRDGPRATVQRRSDDDAGGVADLDSASNPSG